MHQRDPGVAQRVEAGADGQPGDASSAGIAVGVDAELVAEVERTGAAGQLDHIVGAVDRLEAPLAVVALDQPGDVLVEDRVAEARAG